MNKNNTKLDDLYNKICQTLAFSINLIPMPIIDHNIPAIMT